MSFLWQPPSCITRGLIALAATLSAVHAQADVIDRNMRVDGMTVRYKVVLPADYDPSAQYPAILVFGGGPQTMRAAEGTLERNFREQAESRGYIVIAPAAPDDELFFRGGARIFPGFLDAVLDEYNIEQRKFHVAGPSNGGIAAFHVAARNPEYFASVTAFPGYMWEPSSDKLDAISRVCVFAYIGENDRYPWHEEIRREIEYLNARGTLARFSLELGQPHRLATLAEENAGRLFDNFDFARANECYSEVRQATP